MKHKSDHLEVRVLELEDVTRLIVTVMSTLTEMVSTLNKTIDFQTDLITALYPTSSVKPDTTITADTIAKMWKKPSSNTNRDDIPPWHWYED